MARGKAKRRAVRRLGITVARANIFFETLAASCNVTLSATTAGLASSTVYRRRMTDAAFRTRWGEALSTGYAQLELALLERALHGVAKVVTIKGESQIIRDYCDRTALALLKMHRETVSEIDSGADESEVSEASERILERLRRMRLQIEGRPETKSRIDRLALLREALAWRVGQ